MRISIFTLISVLSAIAALSPHALRADVSTRDSVFTVATYNVLNLFDAYDDPYSRDEQTVPVPKPAEELDALVEVIRSLDADLLALQEVENRGGLRRLKNKFLKNLRYRDPVLYEGNDLRGIDVALLSRFPVGQVTSYRHLQFPRGNGKTTRFSRDLLRVRVMPAADLWIDVYVVHFKSGSRRSDVEKRRAEAARAREILDAELKKDPEYRFIILGDFNGRRNGEAVRIMEGTGDGRLFCLTDELDGETVVTYIHDGTGAQLDYIFCSPSMKAFYIAGSVRVVTSSEAEAASDHRPVVASFRISPSK